MGFLKYLFIFTECGVGGGGKEEEKRVLSRLLAELGWGSGGGLLDFSTLRS